MNHSPEIISLFSFNACLNPLRKNIFEEYFLFSNELWHIESDKSLSLCLCTYVGISDLIINPKRR